MSYRYILVPGRHQALTKFQTTHLKGLLGRDDDLCDFLAKKDYANSWHSEMHERFCFWEYKDWVQALEEVGFEMQDGSEAKQNPWLIENRFAPAAKVFEKTDKGLIAVEPPVTNALLIARKP